MTLASAFSHLQLWFLTHWLQLSVTVVLVAGYLVLDRLSVPRIEAGAESSRLQDSVARRAVSVARVVFAIVGFIVLVVVWGIDVGSILVFASTALTLLGVAFFASWSLLSNVTAHFVLLLQPSFRRGNFVRIIDGDNYAEGYIADLTLFNARLVTEAGETILYPNNLILTRAVQVNPQDRRQGLGKVEVRTAPEAATVAAERGIKLGS